MALIWLPGQIQSPRTHFKPMHLAEMLAYPLTLLPALISLIIAHHPPCCCPPTCPHMLPHPQPCPLPTCSHLHACHSSNSHDRFHSNQNEANYVNGQSGRPIPTPSHAHTHPTIWNIFILLTWWWDSIKAVLNGQASPVLVQIASFTGNQR